MAIATVVPHVSNKVDADLETTIALADGAAGVNSASIDTGAGVHIVGRQIEVEAPAMNVTEMPDAKTMIYDIQDSADDSSFADISELVAVITQTGAGGVGCATSVNRIGLPADHRRYVRLSPTGSASGDATTATAEVRVLANS
tara:strand:- start:417 stop:845 length:429 start_codon:yes stop_codon:yes gene_type:complete